MVASKDISPVQFETGSADLLADSNAVLDKVAETAQKYPDLRLRVEGHTDNVGAPTANQTLSEKRSQAVVTWLSSHGIEGDRLKAKGWGQSKPVDDNKTEDGRAKNRRVELVKIS